MHRCVFLLTCTIVLVTGFNGAAWAALNSVSVTSTTPGDPSGFVVNDIFITFDGVLTNAGMLTSGLSVGDIYQDPGGGTTAPLSSSSTALLNDSFVHFGAPTSDDPNALPPVITNGASDLGGSTSVTFDTQLINIAYYMSPGTTVTTQTDYFIGRLTLANTANGLLDLLVPINAENQFYRFEITNGTVGNGREIIDPLEASLGDFNLDGDVSTLDVAGFVEALTAVAPTANQIALGDFNTDGDVSTLDVSGFVTALTAVSSLTTEDVALFKSAGITVIPEPASAALVGLSSLALVSYRRRQA